MSWISVAANRQQPGLLSVQRTQGNRSRGRKGGGSYRRLGGDGGGFEDGRTLGFGSEDGSGTGSGQSVMCHCGTEPVQRTDWDLDLSMGLGLVAVNQ